MYWFCWIGLMLLKSTNDLSLLIVDTALELEPLLLFAWSIDALTIVNPGDGLDGTVNRMELGFDDPGVVFVTLSENLTPGAPMLAAAVVGPTVSVTVFWAAAKLGTATRPTSRTTANAPKIAFFL